MFDVEFKKSAFKELSKLEKNIQQRIVDHIELLRENPFESRPLADIARVKGEKIKMFRLRVGDYRIFYAVEGVKIIVISVEKRAIAYRL